MTALENVMVGRHVRTHSGLGGAVFRTAGFKAEEAAIASRAQELLDYVGIGRFAQYKARTLSYGDQRRLEIARALATDPKLIALDEPAAGMNASEKVVLRELIDQIRWEESTREISNNSREIFPADAEHIRAAIALHQPRVVIAFGRIAIDAVGPCARLVRSSTHRIRRRSGKKSLTASSGRRAS